MKILLSLFILGLVGCSSISSQAGENVDILRKIHYGPDSKQIVDVYQTQYCLKNKCPVVMWVHGGGWRNGDTSRSNSTSMQSLWAQQGIVMVGVNYRLSPDVMHPEHVKDVAGAINWVYKNISKHGGDPKRISLLGHSAGAHLVALVATNPKYLGAYGFQPAQVIKNVFPIDTASFDLTDDSSRFVGRLVNNAFGTNPEVLRDASPISQVYSGNRYPAFIIAAASSRDDAVNTSKILQNKLREAGASAELIVVDYPGLGQLKAHGEIARDLVKFDKEMTKKLLQRVKSGQ